MSISPLALNDDFLSMILNSNPNFNLLYSSYTANYTDPTIQFDDENDFKKTQNLINLLYGADLEVIF